MNKETETIDLPVLVYAENWEKFKIWRSNSGFAQHEAKFLKSTDDLHGYRHRTLFIIGYPIGVGYVMDYAKQHNIKVVRG